MNFGNKIKEHLKNPYSLFFLVNLLLFTIFLILNLTLPLDDGRWRAYHDCLDYLSLSGTDLNYNFIFPVKNGYAYPHGFTVPLFYKLWGPNVSNIIIGQRIVYTISVAVFAYCTHHLFSKRYLKYLWSLSCYVVLSSWACLEWSQFPLSESLGHSLTLLWLATLIYYENKPSRVVLILNLLILIFLFFSRDNIPYIVLTIYVLILLVKLVTRKKIRATLISLCFAIAIFLVHNKSVIAGERHRLPLTNTIAVRIASNPDYLAWFKKEGMPMADEIGKNFVGIDPDGWNREKVYNMYDDSTYKPFFKWVVEHGKPTYVKFMLTHPSYLFLFHEDWSKMNKKLFNDNNFFFGDMQGYTAVFPAKLFLFPPESLLILFLLSLPLILISRLHLYNFGVLLLSLLAMLLINYNSDAFEVSRHMYLNFFIRELLGFLFIFFILDNLAGYQKTVTYLKNLKTNPETKERLKKLLPLLVNLLLFVLFLIFNLSIPYDDNQWRSFPDSYDYLSQTSKDINYDFFFPVKNSLAFPRGFTVPLLYKFFGLFGQHVNNIVNCQIILYSISVAVFAYCTQHLFKKTYLKYLWCIACYIVLAAWSNLGWTQLPVSESISMSLFLLWLATYIYLENKKSTLLLIFNLFVLTLLFFSRDNMPYLILCIYVLHLGIKLVLKQKITRTFVSLCFAILVFMVHNKSVTNGERHRLPLVNTIVVRIVSQPEYLNWFKDQGMPMAEILKRNFPNINPDDESHIKVYNMYPDSSYKPFFDWVNRDGKSKYIKFMLTHFSYLLLLEEDWSKMDKKLFFDNSFYFGEMRGYSAVFPSKLFLFPPDSLLVLFILAIPLLFVSRTHLLNFILLIFSLAAMLLINYNSDTFEVGRHMYLNFFIRELLGFLLIFFILDNLAAYPKIGVYLKKRFPNLIT